MESQAQGQTENQAAELMQTLADLSRAYQGLAEALRLEREALISADIEKLAERTKAKEVLLYRIRALDKVRLAAAKKLADRFGLTDTAPRLLQLADHCEKKGEAELAKLLRTQHQVLSLHVQRSQEQNAENEIYAGSALKILHGSMSDIQQTLTEKPTYGKQGKMAGSLETSAGQLVRKEA